MTEQIEMPEESLLPKGAGAQLRLAREKMGLSIAQMSERTRIPQRQIATIEAGNLSALPGRAYAVGFARTLAREAGLDEEAIVATVRAELNQLGPSERDQRQTYEPGDPARAPSGRLVWVSVIAVLLLLAGLFMAARVLFAPAAQLPSLIEETEEAAQPVGGDVASTATAPSGAVTFTARDTVWVRFSTADGTRLMEGEMAAGQSYTVPPDASGPRILTGRPDLLDVTIGGQAVPPLSTLPQTVSNLPVDAASLLARAAQPAPGASPAAVPAAAQPVATGRPAAQAAPRAVASPAAALPADTPPSSPAAPAAAAGDLAGAEETPEP